jgi:hypothetical protein
MQRLGLCGIFTIPLMAALIGLSGCSTEKKADKAQPMSDGAKTPAAAATAPKSGEKQELVAKAWGSLKGKVTFDGTPPSEEKVNIPDSFKEKDICLHGDIRKQEWKIGPDKGVANVIVWLRAPKGKFFVVPEDQQKAEVPEVKLDQPFCAFEPHVFALYPSFFDPKPKRQKPTGQIFKVVNSAPFNHNTNWTPSDSLVNSGANQIIASKREIVIPAKPSKDKDVGGEQQFKFRCDIHIWMNGYCRIFDHPYEAVTSGDAKDAKDFGNYEIKKVPAGEEVEIYYWHESMSGPKLLKSVTLKEGVNTEDFKISK